MSIPLACGIFFCFLPAVMHSLAVCLAANFLNQFANTGKMKKAHLRHAFVSDFLEVAQEKEVEAGIQKLVAETARRYNKGVTNKIESRN